jgi:hypothetical protein
VPLIFCRERGAIRVLTDDGRTGTMHRTPSGPLVKWDDGQRLGDDADICAAFLVWQGGE